jgi:cytochrome d ubiquinol oxidase subunit I
MIVGSELGVTEATYQPMKIAASEAQWETCQPCSFSLFQIGGGNNDQTPTQIIQIPHLLSVLATGTWNGQVVGLNELQSQYEQQYGPGNYVPNVFIQYWGMRVMAYLACVVLLVAAWGGWLIHRRKLRSSRWFLWAATWLAVTPFFINTAGWLLTESGRQPWIVQGLMLTKDGLSGSGSATQVAISLSIVLVLYTTIGVIAAILMIRHARRGLPDDVPEPVPDSASERPAPSLTY